MQYKIFIATLILPGFFLFNNAAVAADEEVIVQSMPASKGIEVKKEKIIVGKIINPEDEKKRRQAEEKKRLKEERKLAKLKLKKQSENKKQSVNTTVEAMRQGATVPYLPKKTERTVVSTRELQKTSSGKYLFAGVELPENYRQVTIFGEAQATKAQAVALIKNNNPSPKLSCSVEDLVNFYWEEAEREGVRPDLALAQSVLETGSYAYGGDVHPSQNNFCGLGTTGGGVKGAKFSTPKLGVRAHIQHLLAYTQQKRPTTPIIDPRYELAHNIRLERGVVDTWYGLNGTWAMGSLYCEKIMAHHQKMLSLPGGSKQDSRSDKAEESAFEERKKSIKERVRDILQR